MQARRTSPEVDRLLRPQDPTFTWRVLVGVLTVVATLSILGNVLFGVLFVDYSQNRSARVEAVAVADQAKKSKEAAEAALAGRDAKVGELSAKAQELEFAMIACRNDKERIERELATAKAGTDSLPLIATNRVLQRITRLRFQAAISGAAVQAGVRDGAVVLQAQSAARGMGAQLDESSQVAVIIQVSGVDQGTQGSCWVVEAAVTEPWRVPGKESSYRVAIYREAKFLSTAKKQGVEADVLSVVDDVTKSLLERLATAKSEK